MPDFTNNPPHHPPFKPSTLLSTTHLVMNCLNRNNIQECREYEVTYHAFLRRVDEPPMVPIPRRWWEYLKMSYLYGNADPSPLLRCSSLSIK